MCNLFREVWLHRLKEEPQHNLTSSWTDHSVLPIFNPGPHILLLLLNPDFPKGSMHTGTHCMIISFRFFHFSKSLANPLSTFCLPKTVDTCCPFSFYCVFIIFFYSLGSFGGVSGWNVSAYIQPAIINWIVSRISLFSYSFSCRHLNKRSLCLCMCALF